jgi:hypothetical protein
MDPYLEDPGLWPDVHARFIAIASDYLAARLRPKYFVRIEERVYISDENDPGRSVLVPDIRIAIPPGREWTAFAPGDPYEREAPEPIVATTMMDDEIHESRLEIVDRQGRTVVTVIELISPTNKVPGSRGRASFEMKRREVMNSPSHWIEIDLLRAGQGLYTRESIPPCEYLVHLSHVDRRPSGWLWPIRLSQRLPNIKVPLRPEDPDASLDLQTVLTTAYDRAGYDLSVDYTRDPVPPLTGEWVAWSDGLLKAKGLRPA